MDASCMDNKFIVCEKNQFRIDPQLVNETIINYGQRIDEIESRLNLTEKAIEHAGQDTANLIMRDDSASNTTVSWTKMRDLLTKLRHDVKEVAEKYKDVTHHLHEHTRKMNGSISNAIDEFTEKFYDKQSRLEQNVAELAANANRTKSTLNGLSEVVNTSNNDHNRKLVTHENNIVNLNTNLNAIKIAIASLMFNLSSNRADNEHKFDQSATQINAVQSEVVTFASVFSVVLTCVAIVVLVLVVSTNRKFQTFMMKETIKPIMNEQDDENEL